MATQKPLIVHHPRPPKKGKFLYCLYNFKYCLKVTMDGLPHFNNIFNTFVSLKEVKD